MVCSMCKIRSLGVKGQGKKANSYIFSSPEPKAQGELIGWESSGRPSLRATDMDLGAFLVVWR